MVEFLVILRDGEQRPLSAAAFVFSKWQRCSYPSTASTTTAGSRFSASCTGQSTIIFSPSRHSSEIPTAVTHSLKPPYYGPSGPQVAQVPRDNRVRPLGLGLLVPPLGGWT